MRIQRLLFPSTDTCDRTEMYYRLSGGARMYMAQQRCLLPEGAELKANTYFNGFSAGKWHRYTVLDNLTLCLKLSGAFTVQLCHVRRSSAENITHVITEVMYPEGQRQQDLHGSDLHGSSEEMRPPAGKEDGLLYLPIPLTESDGMYYFSLRSEAMGSAFLGGWYETEADPASLPPVRIAIDICTYRRESYVAHNVQLLRDQLIGNEKSPLFGNLEVFIIDNGQTLNETQLFDKGPEDQDGPKEAGRRSEGEEQSSGDADAAGEKAFPPDKIAAHVRIFPNKNVGGSGGFTRGMLEILKVREQLGITHILMMDDDVRIEPHALELTCCFLRLLKDEYRGAFIGGAMLRVDRTNIQTDNGAVWTGNTIIVPKGGFDLEKEGRVLVNEIEEPVNYAGWWYCCMPADVLREDNLPLPFFIKRDDIEYALRNMRQYISLNGICVWHEAFEAKGSAYLDYYYFRNMCIMNARHFPWFGARQLDHALHSYVRGCVQNYQYREAELAMLGVEDFLKGIDWMKAQDGEEINRAVMQMGYEKKPVEKLPLRFSSHDYEYELKHGSRSDKENKWHRRFRKLTLNGWLLPARRISLLHRAKRIVIVPAFAPEPGAIYRAQKVIFYEESTGKGWTAEKDWSRRRAIYRRYRRMHRAVLKKYDRIAAEYRDRYEELTRIDFWEEYLKRDAGKT